MILLDSPRYSWFNTSWASWTCHMNYLKHVQSSEAGAHCKGMPFLNVIAHAFSGLPWKCLEWRMWDPCSG